MNKKCNYKHQTRINYKSQTRDPWANFLTPGAFNRENTVPVHYKLKTFMANMGLNLYIIY